MASLKHSLRARTRRVKASGFKFVIRGIGIWQEIPRMFCSDGPARVEGQI